MRGIVIEGVLGVAEDVLTPNRESNCSAKGNR
jgi:hypothetical protein